MGSFTIIPDSSNIVSGFFINNTASGKFGPFDLVVLQTNDIGVPPPYPRILQGFDPPAVATIDNLLRMSFGLTTNVISLDGDPRISFAGLPLGFVVDSALISLYTDNNGSDAINHFRIQFDESTESGDKSFVAQSFSHPNSTQNPIPSSFLFFVRGCGIHVNT